MRKVDIMVIRPSQDLGRLAAQFEPKLPALLKYLTRGLGTGKTASPDVLSFILFQQDYIKRLVELGEADGEAHAQQAEAFARAGE
jgi:NTE family protein